MSGTVIDPSSTSGCGSPLTRLLHSGMSAEWFSSARKCSVAAAAWTLASAATGDPAMCEGHRDAVLAGVVADPLRLEDAARRS